MGIFGFFTTAGWSFGPLYGGFFLDRFADSPEIAWMLISSLALMAAMGYIWFGRVIPRELDRHV
jgi:MFS family permease